MRKLKAFTAIFAIALILVMSTLPAFAMNEVTGSFDIINESTTSEDTITVRVEPIGDAPALSVSEIDVSDSVTVSGTFDEPGVHEYLVYQIVGSNPEIIYDKSVWHVEIHVWVQDGSDELTVTVVVYEENDVEHKFDAVKFRNTLCAQPTPEPTPTPTNPPTPHTGGGSEALVGVIFVVLALVGLGCLLFVLLRKKKDNQQNETK